MKITGRGSLEDDMAAVSMFREQYNVLSGDHVEPVSAVRGKQSQRRMKKSEETQAV